MLTRTLFAGVFMLAAVGCAGEVDEPVATAEQPILNGSWAKEWMWQRAVTFGNCTGTIIAKRHVLTAAHCKPKVGNSVWFYTEPYKSNKASETAIVDVDYRGGVDPYMNDLVDYNGEFADIAVVKIGADIPATSRIADLAYLYPGASIIGDQVGRGAHDGDPDNSGQLRYRLTHTRSSNSSDGSFLTEDQGTHPGDSGGPFYVNREVVGDLYGWVYDWGYRNKYTSVPHYLAWILGKIGYSVATSFTIHETKVVSGDTLESFGTWDMRVCAKACEQRSSCKSFQFVNYGPPMVPFCALKDGTTLTGGYPNTFVAALKKTGP